MQTSRSDTRAFEKFLLQRGTIEKKDLKDIRAMKNDANVSLGIIALNRGILTAAEVKRILDAQGTTKKRFGTVAVDLSLLDKKQVHELLAEQTRINFDIGEILVLQGRLSPEELEKERRAFLRQKRRR